MDHKNYFFVILVVLLVILAGSIPFLLSRPSGLSQLPEEGATSERSRELKLPAPPEVRVYAKGRRTLVVTWDNLPEGTTRLNVFRSLIGKNQWIKWNVIDVPSNTGSVTLTGGASENLNKYEFYVQAVNVSTPGGSGGFGTSSSAGGELEIILWTSPVAPPAEYPTSTTQTASSTDTGSGTQSSSTSSEGATSTPQGAAPSSTASSGSSSSTEGGSSNIPAGHTPYYTPQGELSGTTGPQTATFWVQHVNKNIEIGWQNIPTESTLAIVYRSINSNGPWTELLRQTSPQISYSIRLVDNTLDQSYYYKLELREGNTILATYGPVLLNALPY